MRHFVFDAYGTLFDVHSAAERHADAIGPRWQQMSQIWRTKHIEYTWLHAATGKPATFWALASRALDFAAAVTGGIEPHLKAALLRSYRTLGAYPEVAAVLRALREQGSTTSILTNGDPDMIADAVAAAGLEGLLDHVMTVSEAGIFKPHAPVYQLACNRLGVAPAKISFQSSNRWDVAAGTAFGFSTVWINRAGGPDEYPDMPARHVVRSLATLSSLYS